MVDVPNSYANDKKTIINKGTKEQLLALGHKRSYLKTVLFHLFSILCFGFPYVLMYWNKVFGIHWQYVQCGVKEAQVLVLEDVHGQTYIAEVHEEPVGCSFPSEFSITSERRSKNLPINEKTSLLSSHTPYALYFFHQHVKYMWNKHESCFQMLIGIQRGIQLSHFHQFTGYSTSIQESKLQLYGYNTIAVDIKSYWRLLIDEVLNPFYLFEIFGVVVWTADEYTLYAGIIFLLSIVSVVVALYEIRQQSQTLKNMATAHGITMIKVCRGDEVYENTSAVKLVPGDVIAIPPTGCFMPCDAVLVAGTCIVNESVLTGESCPETKTPAPDLDEAYCSDIHAKHTLFCGTQVLQTRYYGQDKVLAVVIRTGFTTAKGELVRSILYPKPIGFKFYMDSIRFVLLLLAVAVAGISYCVYVYVTKGATLVEIVIRACDMLTIVVPPAMPWAMTVGCVYSQARLRKAGIFCISPPRINVSGKLKLMCFDKTGTLTEGGLEFCGVAPRLADNTFGDLIRDPAKTLEQRHSLLVALAACHTLTRIEGQLIGDPLELEMFKSSQWVLEEPGADITRYDVMAPIVVKPVTRDMFTDLCGADFTEADFEVPYAVGIVRQFPFSSSLQRMSVVVRTLGSSHMELLCKGSPEKIRSLCLAHSVPDDFTLQLRKYTMRGYRVLALAHRVLDRRLTWHQMHRLKRHQMESNLQFLGLLVMHNTLKPETTPVIRELQSANIRCLMVTGDHLLTAINVARKCELLPVGDKVVLVTATAPVHSTDVDIQFSLVESYEVADPQPESLNSPGLAASTNSSNTSQPWLTESWPESIFEPLEDINQRLQCHVSVDVDGAPVSRRLHFALSGKTLDVIRKHCPIDLLQKILCRSTVLARMGPDQKTKVVEDFQALGYVVGMCGDGANDCGALKAAHVGISLSDAEASVAAPITSRSTNISCVPAVIREGRCALVTSFGVFKYMALYSLIQFISVLILYSLRTTFGDYMFLYHDLVVTTSVAVLMARTEPYGDLAAQRPKGSLLSSANLLSLAMQIALTAAIQLGALWLLMTQPWYEPVQPSGDEVIVPCWEVTVLFSVSSFQYLILALAFSYGPPYRQPFYTNTLFLLSLVVLTTFTLVLILLPIGPLADFFQVMRISWNPLTDPFKFGDDDLYPFRAYVLLLVALHFLVSLFIEELVSGRQFSKTANPSAHSNRNVYKRVERQVDSDHTWPPLSSTTPTEVLSL